MGNFYANIVLRDADLDAVAELLDTLGRRAYVAHDGRSAVVYDERCDEQDLEALEQLARTLSAKLDRTAIAFCNHDDDVLWYALVEGGKVTDKYESDPSYFEGGESRGTSSGGDARRLCEAFGVPARRDDVEQLLRASRRDVGFEIDRHVKLLEQLELAPELAILGYGYVGGGELSLDDGRVAFRAVGGAPDPFEPGAGSPNAKAASVGPTAEGLSAMQAEASEIMKNGATLAFSEVDIPPRFSRILGKGRVNGYTALLRLQLYIVRNKLSPSPSMEIIYADDAVAELLGERKFHYIALARLLVRALGVPPLSAAHEAAMKAGDAAFYLRFHEAIQAAASAVDG